MDGIHKVVGIAAFRDIALGADFDGASGEYRIIVHAEYDDACGRVAPEDAPRQFKSRHGRQVDIENADIRMLFVKRALTTLCVGGFEDDDLGVVGEQCTASRSNDAMVINDQNTHWR